MAFKIYGKVIEKETGRGISNLRVKAVDKDLLFDDLLGAVTTDENGNFEIKYYKEDFQELFFDKKPDIYLKIENPEGEVIHTTEDKVRYEAGKTEAFNINISKNKIKKQKSQNSLSKQLNISFVSKKLAILHCAGSVELKNSNEEKATVNLKLVGSKAFSIPENFQSITIRPKSMKRIPVKFQIDEKNIGWPMALSSVYRAGIRVWGEDTTKKMLLGIIPVSEKGPALVPFLQCMETGSTNRRTSHKGNSPPSITISAVKPGTDIPKNTGTVEVNWMVDGADDIWDAYGHVGQEVLEPGTFTDIGAVGGPDPTPAVSSFTYTPGSTLNFLLTARNADGEVWVGETIFYKARIGYHNARCPAGASIDSDEVDQIRGFLDDIDGRLRTNALENLPSFVEEWNESLDARPDIPSDVRDRYRFPEFDDMDYLSGRLGTGSLTDDILNAMIDALIYVKPRTLPMGHRPGTTSEGEHALCDVWDCDGIECRSLGKTYYSSTDPDCNWVGICVETGADALTLLHELYHYSIGSGDEAKAVAVSCCVFGYIPWV